MLNQQCDEILYDNFDMENRVLNNQYQICNFCLKLFDYSSKDNLYLICLNDNNEVIQLKDISFYKNNNIYTIRQKLNHITTNKLISKVVLTHNHIFDNELPSALDVEITCNISQHFKTIGIKLLDHVIISNNSFLSFKMEELPF